MLIDASMCRVCCRCVVQVKKTLLRWKPDWEGAARYYRDAVKAYKMSGDHVGTIQGQNKGSREHTEQEEEEGRRNDSSVHVG